MRRPSPKKVRREAEAAVKAWTHPEGTAVTVRKDDGSLIPTKTRSMPWLLGESAVILLEGISGGYLLDRVTALEVSNG